ncbi:type II toxin-antitoxin system RelE/ParE family toxin [Caulobacter hibisci]|uniref:Type II toxin-antitoxin system RelE/ParE family toxin n=1 Tax=Caulobacter hibisci TaxID=2035993 RepID=A0ABS0SVK3_9CAUL|nr:type II toxin-antitoxin system RelE/ParE family toxin [Caulobacter hibisci]
MDKNPSAARRAGQIIAASIRSLAEYAERGQIGPRKDLRRLQVPFGDSGYVVEYQITPTEVLITRIKHARER